MGQGAPQALAMPELDQPRMAVQAWSEAEAQRWEHAQPSTPRQGYSEVFGPRLRCAARGTVVLEFMMPIRSVSLKHFYTLGHSVRMFCRLRRSLSRKQHGTSKSTPSTSTANLSKSSSQRLKQHPVCPGAGRGPEAAWRYDKAAAWSREKRETAVREAERLEASWSRVDADPLAYVDAEGAARRAEVFRVGAAETGPTEDAQEEVRRL